MQCQTIPSDRSAGVASHAPYDALHAVPYMLCPAQVSTLPVPQTDAHAVALSKAVEQSVVKSTWGGAELGGAALTLGLWTAVRAAFYACCLPS